MLYKVNLKQLEEMFNRIAKEYTVISPTLENGVISYKKNAKFSNLPAGFRQAEFPGSYQVYQDGKRFFSYIRPSNTLKHFLRPSPFILFTVKKAEDGLEFEYQTTSEKLAVFDIRRCDLKALKILDNVYLNQQYPDTYYLLYRENLLLVGVDCFEASAVCFCGSMVDIDETYGADLFITEIDDGFLVDLLSEKAERLLEGFKLTAASEEDIQKRKTIRESFTQTLKKQLNTKDLKETLYNKIEHPYWEEIGKRCLSCTNCTQVCPTCFCFDIKEINSLDLRQSERVVVWDSCFNQQFATVHKFNIRDTVASRYRQWLMHKMAYWQDQFGDLGCVGCGRCITWCPAKIDIQQETSKLREI